MQNDAASFQGPVVGGARLVNRPAVVRGEDNERVVVHVTVLKGDGLGLRVLQGRGSLRLEIKVTFRLRIEGSGSRLTVHGCP